MFLEKEGKLIYSYDGETAASKRGEKMHCVCARQKIEAFTGRDWALEAKDAHAGEVRNLLE